MSLMIECLNENKDVIAEHSLSEIKDFKELRYIHVKDDKREYLFDLRVILGPDFTDWDVLRFISNI